MKRGYSTITENTSIGEILASLSEDQVAYFTRICEAYGLQAIGYGIQHDESLKECARKQGVEDVELSRIIGEIKRKVVRF